MVSVSNEFTGGTTDKSRALEYSRNVTKFMTICSTGGEKDMTNVFNIATTERFINQHMAGGNGPSWAKNVLLYICKFGDYLLGKQKISQALLAAYKSDSQGMKSTLARPSQRRG